MSLSCRCLYIDLFIDNLQSYKQTCLSAESVYKHVNKHLQICKQTSAESL